MNHIVKIIFLVLVLLSTEIMAQLPPKPKTDANIFGHVIDAATGEHLPFVTIGIRGTTIGTTTDQTGHFRIINAPVGTYILQASFTGYKTTEILITTEEKKSIEIDFELDRETLRLGEVVVSASRFSQQRTESPAVVNSITPKLFSGVQAVVLSEGLNFAPGLRMETNCSNCGLSQVRINGLEGSYSQILINGRPLFSGLASAYGLELIPAGMIDRVEVIKGGGNTLYGGSAIGGTINIRLREPVSNTYEVGADMGFVGTGRSGAGTPATDKSLNASISTVSDDGKTGLSIFGFARNRNAFDANNDGFSELVDLDNTTFGTRIYQRLSQRSKLTLDFFRIEEERRGGNRFDYQPHEADISEWVEHSITTGGLTWEQFVGKSDLLTVFANAQNIDRNSYFGANQSQAGYGETSDITLSAGFQYKANVSNGTLVMGSDLTTGQLTDTKQGYPDLDNAVIENGAIIEIPHTDNLLTAKENALTAGIFTQYEKRFNRLKLTLGLRYDHYSVDNEAAPDSKVNNGVLLPALSAMYDIRPFLQGRLSYAKGYRAPRIFDEDLHAEVSGSRKVIYTSAPGLKQENSNTLMTSLDFNKMIGKSEIGLLAEGFVTLLDDPFVISYGEPDENGVVVNTRSNSDKGASVQGLNLELNFTPREDLRFYAGFTLQSSLYEEAQDFGEKRFLRTPNQYGFLTFDWQFIPDWTLTANGAFTGSMLVPYFGPTIENPDQGELRRSDPFFDMGFKLNYTLALNVTKISFYTGVKNLFNSYQKDFDTGINRDPSYVYGPTLPRMIYFGVKMGNML